MSKVKANFIRASFHFLKRNKFGIILFLFTCGSIIFFLNQPICKSIKGINIIVCKSASVDSILAIEDSIVTPVLYQKVPDLRDLHYKERMVKFVDMMLPSVLMAREKMIKKREKILEIKSKIEFGKGLLSDSIYIKSVQKEYESENVEEVIKRLYPHPVSIIIAQAAIESGWATSRFCREANNIYGIWSYNSSERRIKAGKSRKGTNIYLRKYDSLFESVYDYLQTIAKVYAYKGFRERRLTSNNPYQLIWYLSNYSEKRYEYVRMLRNLIEFNDLTKYDNYSLAKINKKDPVWKAILE